MTLAQACSNARLGLFLLPRRLSLFLTSISHTRWVPLGVMTCCVVFDECYEMYLRGLLWISVLVK